MASSSEVAGQREARGSAELEPHSAAYDWVNQVSQSLRASSNLAGVRGKDRLAVFYAAEAPDPETAAACPDS